MTEIITLDGPIEFLSISDDGKTIAATGTRYDENSVAEASQSAVWRDGELILLPGKRIEAMSPSGRTIAMGFDDDTLEIVADGKQTALVPTAHAAWVELPDDTVVVTMSGDGQFTRASVDGSNNETTQIPMGMSRVDGALSPNGARFTYISQGLENDVWDLAGPLENQAGEATFTGRTGNARISDIALSYNGNRMATAAAGSIFVSDVQTKDAALVAVHRIAWRRPETRLSALPVRRCRLERIRKQCRALGPWKANPVGHQGAGRSRGRLRCLRSAARNRVTGCRQGLDRE